MPLLQQMLQHLLQAGRGREAEVLIQTLAFVAGLLPPALHEGISHRALQLCEDTSMHVRVGHCGCTGLQCLVFSFAHGAATAQHI